MIVRNLLARFGFMVDSSGLDKVDSKIAGTKAKTGDLTKAFGAAAGALAALGLGAKALQAVDESVAFSRVMGQIQTLIPGNIKLAQEYRDEIRKLSLESGKSQIDVANGLYDTLSTVGATQDTLGTLRLAVQSGLAGAGTTGDGLKAITAVTKVWGDTSQEMSQKVADLNFETVNLGVVTLPELASSIQTVTPIAKLLGMSMEEMYASIATSSGTTGSASEGTTQLRSILTSLLHRKKEMEVAFKSLNQSHGGFGSAEEALQTHGLQGTMKLLLDHVGGSAEGFQKLFGRVEAFTLATTLAKTQANDYADKLDHMKNVSGRLKTAIDAQTTGMGKAGFEADVAKAKYDDLELRIGDELMPTFLALKGNLLGQAETIHTSLVPALQALGTEYGNVGEQADLAANPLTLILGVVKGLLVPFVMLNSGLQETGIRLGSVAAAAAAFATGDWRGGKAILAQASKDVEANHKKTVRQIGDIGMSITDPEGLAEVQRVRKGNQTVDQRYFARNAARLERTRDQQANVRKGDIHNTIGQLIVQTSGTTSEQAEQIAQEAGRKLLEKTFRRVHEVHAGGADQGGGQ